MGRALRVAKFLIARSGPLLAQNVGQTVRESQLPHAQPLVSLWLLLHLRLSLLLLLAERLHGTGVALKGHELAHQVTLAVDTTPVGAQQTDLHLTIHKGLFSLLLAKKNISNLKSGELA